ncbi:hypothetical protein B296_00057729 [Ensete ventricosum]|uniref:Uncharacterized protein n=1 Tax=Ensete ventricosum TaxID=4639 RepID=A0A426XGL2_ENSVE|nr:hypothetical protein B296_00057729 [Ensete ventricosum]
MQDLIFDTLIRRLEKVFPMEKNDMTNADLADKSSHPRAAGPSTWLTRRSNQPSVPNRVTANDDMHVNCRTFKQAWRPSERPVKRRRHPIVLSRGIAVVGMQYEGNWNQA